MTFDKPTPKVNSSSTGASRRNSERIDARIAIHFRSGNEYVACYSQNISKGGIYIESETLPDPNAQLELVLHLPENHNTGRPSEELRLRGKVVRLMSILVSSKYVHKVAVQFVDIPTETQLKLDHFYNTLTR